MRIECDRCRHIYDPDRLDHFEYTEDEQPWCMNSEITFSGTVFMGQDSIDLHLCRRCTYELRRWIDNYETN